MKKIITLAGLIAAAVAGVGGIAGTVEAGNEPEPAAPADFIIVYEASGDTALETIDAITPQLFEADGTTEVTGCIAMETNGGAALQYECESLPALNGGGIDYVIGIEGVPSEARVAGIFCTDDARGTLTGNAVVSGLSLEDQFSTARRAHTPFGSICTVDLPTNPAIGIDTVIVGGEATVADFSYDLVDDADAPVASGLVDPQAAQCTPLTGPDGNCTETIALRGDYSLSAATVAPGYAATGFACNGDPATSSTEPGDFTHSTDDQTPTICTVTYTYFTQEIAVDVIVVNDDGGTATAADFTIEIRDASDMVVAMGTDPEPGTGNASAIFTLPLGEYTITVTGPDGYVVTVETTPVDRAADAAVVLDTFTISRTQTVTGVVTANDPTPAPTTSTTTTTTTTTTTVAPTITVDPTDVLPATGSSDSTLPLLLVALVLVLFGAGTVATTRRR